MPENELPNGNGETPEIPEIPEVDPLLEFVKSLLGFYGTGGDPVLGYLILAAQEYLKNAGVKEPEEPDEPTDASQKETALYRIAVATKVKILHDGDLKGDLERTLTSIILQIKDYAGGEVI